MRVSTPSRRTIARARGEQGFTLVELLVASALAGIGFLGLAALHGNAIRSTSVGRNVTIATSLAAEQLERMRRTPAPDLVNVPAATVTVGNRSYQLSATVAAAPAGSSRQVTVNVDWTDQFGPHEVRLVTVIGQ